MSTRLPVEISENGIYSADFPQNEALRALQKPIFLRALEKHCFQFDISIIYYYLTIIPRARMGY